MGYGINACSSFRHRTNKQYHVPSKKRATVPHRRATITLSLFALAVGALTALRASPPIGAVVQTWHYDPLTNIVTLQIVNTSHKDITAFNIAIKETYADGRVEEHEMLEELVGKILAAKELQGDTSTHRGERSFSVSSTGTAHFIRAKFERKNWVYSPD
jgi:hypothetical protein